MESLIGKLRRKIFPEKKIKEDADDLRCDDHLIAFGVLLWAVADADEKFMPAEKQAIKKVLKTCSEVTDKDMDIVLRAVEEAALFRIDLYAFTKEIGNSMDYNARVHVIESLFRVACVDKELDNDELEMIRKISGLIKIDHKVFIESKVKVKKEFGLDTSGL